MNRPAEYLVRTKTVLRDALSVGAAVALLTGCGGSQSALSVPPAGSAAQPSLGSGAYSVLHSFGDSARDGANPSSELIDVGGTLYGTTVYGGSNDAGTVFSITTSGKETVLHSFGASRDGANPMARLLNVNGTLYGTTSSGGANSSGTVFSVKTSGAEKVLHSFTSDGNGVPVAGLIEVGGTLYGTSKGSGAYSGVVFRITTGGTFTVLHIFGKRAPDGTSPAAALLDQNGTLYGTTTGGGNYGRGTIFSISTAGTEKVLYSFGTNGGSDGSQPSSALTDVQGTLYGTTVRGGSHGNVGTVFSVTSNGAEKVIHSFNGNGGNQPVAGLKNIDGVLYGTTSMGGANNLGMVFSMTTNGEEKVLHSFSGGSGVNPVAGLVPVAGTLYGTTYGSVKQHHGNVFSITP
jgi:uncharacterized repeat protein (TIGR03803 family)